MYYSTQSNYPSKGSFTQPFTDAVLSDTPPDKVSKLNIKFVVDRKQPGNDAPLMDNKSPYKSNYPLKQYVSLFEDDDNSKEKVEKRGKQFEEALNHAALSFKYKTTFKYMKDLSPTELKSVNEYILKDDIMKMLIVLYEDTEELAEDTATLKEYFGDDIPCDVFDKLREYNNGNK